MNKRQRKKQAKKQAMKTGVYIPRNTFRSTMSIQTTLFNPNVPKNKKMISLAERNLNRLAFVITKPNIVNLSNLTEDDVKFLQSEKFTHNVENIFLLLAFLLPCSEYAVNSRNQHQCNYRGD